MNKTCVIALILALLLLLAGCGLLRRAPEATPAPTPTLKPTPTPTPAPEVVIPEGDTVTGMVGAVMGEEDGVYLFSFTSDGLSIPVIAHSSVFFDEFGDREAVVEMGDRLEIAFDAPVLEGEYAQGTASKVNVAMYANYEDYSDPMLSAFLWIYRAAPELNEDVGQVAFSEMRQGMPGFSRRFAAALDSFCVKEGYALAESSSEPQWMDEEDAGRKMVFTLEMDAADEDGRISVGVTKSRPPFGEAGAILTLVEQDGRWNVEEVNGEYANIAKPEDVEEIG